MRNAVHEKSYQEVRYEANPNRNFRGQKAALVEVEFGESKKDCAGFGICRISLMENYQHSNPNCKKAKAYMTIGGINGEYILFIFCKAAICNKIYEQYLTSSFFLVNENVPILEPLRSAISTKRITISKAVYKIIENDDYVTIIC